MEIVTVSSVSKTTIVTMLLYLLHLCMKLGSSAPQVTTKNKQANRQASKIHQAHT